MYVAANPEQVAPRLYKKADCAQVRGNKSVSNIPLGSLGQSLLPGSCVVPDLTVTKDVL